jgi:small subunit ribosomal protein S9
MAEVTEQPQEQQQEQQPPTQPQPAAPIILPSGAKHFYGTGRRKCSVARVFLRPGTGEITVNGRAFENFFPTPALRQVIAQPLEAAELTGRFNITTTVAGGGPAGQATAIRLGIARALLEYDVELRKRLKKLGFLTRDARIHERKKYGQKGARKRFQFSKR